MYIYVYYVFEIYMYVFQLLLQMIYVSLLYFSIQIHKDITFTPILPYLFILQYVSF